MEKPSILIVDDEPNIRGALQRWLHLKGFDVHTAENGLDAVELCGKQKFDVITMDLEMPQMGGMEAIVSIRRVCANVPILVVTGMPGDTNHALAVGATKVITKPFLLRDLEYEVRALIDNSCAI